MISSVFQKIWPILKGKPLTLWGVSWLASVLSGLAAVGFLGIPALGFLVSILFQAALSQIFLNACRGGNTQTRDLFAPFAKRQLFHVAKGMAWMHLWIFLWLLVPVAGPVLATVKLYTYRFVPYILTTRPEIRASDALQASKQETRGYRGKLFCADLLVVLAVLVPVLLLGLLAMIPYMQGLFLLVLTVFCLLAAALWPLVTGLLRAMLYDEIQRCLADPAYSARYTVPASPYIPAAPQPSPVPQPAPESSAPGRRCPVCGTPAAPDAKFCNNCGTSLEKSDTEN